MRNIMNNVKRNTIGMVLKDGREVEVCIEISNSKDPYITVFSPLGEDITDEIDNQEFSLIAEIAFFSFDDIDLI